MASRRPASLLPAHLEASLARPALALLWLAPGLLGALAAGPAALGATPVGPEFQVNTYTTADQSCPRVAVDADGDFMVVWQSLGSAGSDTDGRSIQGQRYTGQTPQLPWLGPPGVIGLAAPRLRRGRYTDGCRQTPHDQNAVNLTRSASEPLGT